MNILEILDEVRVLSGRFNDPRLTNNEILRWINTYKKALQRNRRYRFSMNSVQLVAKQNIRSTTLPSNYLSMIALRRSESDLVYRSYDARGNQIIKIKQTILNPHVSKERFLDQFPMQRGEGQSYVGVPNDYMIQGTNIIWGPIPSENETIWIDYYRFFPPYNDSDLIEDDFTVYYDDGLLAYAMTMIFRSWISDKEKLAEWKDMLTTAERGLRLHQIANEHPIESDINLPDN